jgi:hypothetical protein
MTSFESELRSTPLNHGLSHSSSQSKLGEDDESVNYGRLGVEAMHQSGNEKVKRRIISGSDLELDEHSRSSMTGEY